MAIISVKSLSRYFGPKAALNEVSLEVMNGDLFGLFGPNGAGKTTLLKILTGQLEPSSGRSIVMGIDVAEDPMAVKKLVGIVPEVESPPTYLTSYEYLYFVGKVRKVEDIEGKIDEWFSFFDLEDVRDIICRDLSKGMRQKLMLASAFLHDPKLVFLDEPFINLDPIFQRKLRQYLQNYIESGGTIFMCSHILEISERLCNRAAIISNGKLVAYGAMTDLLSKGESLEEIFLRLTEGGG
ncbi:MAG TPA: ABC transporter ATP-binding protein [Euryarchaeota archaeon]|nr:ABC transporter ATP-binding protein [Euryarchaeota archaeon]